MKKILLVAVASLALAAPAFAGLDLTWDACATGPGAFSSTHTMGCAEGDANQLFAVFQSPVAITNWTYVDCFVDLQVAAAALPPFWLFSTPISTGCNAQIALGDSRPLATVCSASNPWGASGSGGDNALGYVPAQGGVPNRGRFVTTSFRNATPFALINANQSYYAWDLVMFGDAEAVDGCTGCATPATIVWNQANAGGAAAQNGAEDVVVTITNSGIVSNCATAGAGAVPCSATPVQNKTWGALKSLYR